MTVFTPKKISELREIAGFDLNGMSIALISALDEIERLRKVIVLCGEILDDAVEHDAKTLKRCPRCFESALDQTWNYCPRCGEALQ